MKPIDKLIKRDIDAGKDRTELMFSSAGPEEMRAQLTKAAADSDHPVVQAQLRIMAVFAPLLLEEFERFIRISEKEGLRPGRIAEQFMAGAMVGAISSSVISLISSYFDAPAVGGIGLDLADELADSMRKGTVGAVGEMVRPDGEKTQ